jgi:ribonuclease VapC
MVVDSSALLAILLGETEAIAIATALANEPACVISAVSELETAIVTETRKGSEGLQHLKDLLVETAIETAPMSLEQVRLAREAYARFGKGRHPAGLNLGDCCSYALARERGEPLLFKGGDFSQTDIEVARY